jgi:flagellar M-ring protein FliF
MLVLAIAITAAVTLFMWNDQADYKPVFGAREKVAASDMMTVLEAEHVPYRVHPDSGQVLVPPPAGQGAHAAGGQGRDRPAAGRPGTDGQERSAGRVAVRAGRALPPRPRRRAGAVDPDDRCDRLGARAPGDRQVDLLRRQRRRQVLGLGGGRGQAGPHLSNEQIAAIVNLVSGSVASLAPNRVSLVDQNGNYLSSRVDLSDGFDGAAQGDAAAKRFQDEVRANVNELLGPVLGADNFKVSVTADVDNDKIEETQEKYGEAPKVTSEAMREEMEKNRMALGVPGTLSNRPPVSAIRPTQAARRRAPTRTRPRATTAARARTPPPASTPTTARSPRSSARAAA